MSSSMPEIPPPSPSSSRRWSWAWPWQTTQSLWWGPSGLWHADGPGGAATRWDDLDAWCAAHAGQRAALWVSGWWVVDVLVDAALPLADDAALLAYVRPLLQHYHGDAAAPWPLAAWQAGEARGVSALHGLDLDALRHSARRHGVHLAALQPWWARALRLALAQASTPRQPSLVRAPEAQLCVVEGRLVTRLDLRRGELVGLQQRRLAQASTRALRDWLADEPVAVQRCLGYGLDDDAGDAPIARHARDALDGARPGAQWWAGRASAADGQGRTATTAARRPVATDGAAA